MNRRTKSKFRTAVCLTEGTPWRVLLIYAAPIVLSYLLQQIYVLTDAIICGQVLTGPQVAGVNDTYPLTFIFLQFAFGCTAGFSVITAQCVGRGDHDGIRRSFAVQIALTLAISVVLTAMSVSMLPWMLRVLHVTPDNPAVYDAAYAYCLVIFIGIAAQMGYNFICGVLRAYGDSITPLIFLGFSTVLNIGLDLLFLSATADGAARRGHCNGTGAAHQRDCLRRIRRAQISRAPRTKIGFCDRLGRDWRAFAQRDSAGTAIFDPRHRNHHHAKRGGAV